MNHVKKTAIQISLVATLGLGNLGAAFACALHGNGLAHYPLGMRNNAFSELNNPAAQGMALSAKPRYTVEVGKETVIPFTVIVPESFEQPKVTWSANKEANLAGDANVEVQPGSDQELLLTVAPSEAGMYALRGKLSAQLDGSASTKSSFIIVKAIAATPQG